MRSINLFSIAAVMFILSCDGSADTAGTGQAGSMTRFAIQGERMYVVDHSAIKVFDISQNAFNQVSETPVAVGLETIFASGQYLYLGANDAMYIYSISDADRPSFVFRYAHVVSCDPVVVQGNRAYVTMRGGSACNRGSNALEIIDITDAYEPKFVAGYPMASPHGLAVDGQKLFVCDGAYGLKVFDITSEDRLDLTDEKKDIFAYDVIARNGVATVTGDDGIFQFSYGAADRSIQLLSTIPVSREEL